MSIVQPGQVPTYTPSPPVTLTGYSDSDRTRFLFNGNQFVKARLDLTRPSFGYVGYYDTELDETIEYKNYKTTAGKYVLVDGDRQEAQATGAPQSYKSHFIIIGFPVQVSTTSVVIWSTSRFDYYSFFSVQYTYDNPDVVSSPFYFDAGVSSVVEAFDFTENKYKYTITLDGSYTARYFKIDASKLTTLASDVSAGATSITVASTTGFPDSISDQYVSVEGDVFLYTSKTGTVFNGVSGVDSHSTGDNVLFRPIFAHLVTEVEIGTSYTPLLEFWNTNGSQATSRVLDDDFYYDIIYDKSQDIYYTVRYNEDLNGTAGATFDPSDNFNSTEAGFNSVRWSESSTESNFQHNTSSGTLDYANSSSPGRLTTKYYMDGDFTSQIDVGFNNVTSSGANVSIRAVDYDKNNVFVQMGFVGPWRLTDVKDGDWEAVHSRITTDTTAGTASIYNLRLNSTVLSEGSTQYTLTFDSGPGEWVLTDSIGGSHSNVVPGEDYTSGPLSFSIVHTGTPSNGAQLVLDLNTQLYNLPTDTAWDWKIGLEKSGNLYTCKYDEGSGFVSFVSFTNTNSFGANIELYANGNNESIDLSMDNFAVTGSPAFSTIQVLSIEAVDSIGHVTTVSGLTDDAGYIIKRLDILNSDLDYNSLIDGRVQLATDGLSNGNLYIKYGTNLYKYAKSSFPLDLEDGSSSLVYKGGVISETDAVAFSYNSYSQAGLCYVEYDAARSGTYLKTISTTTMSGTENESYLDVSTSNYPFAWDVNNYTVLYYVNGTSLKEYDMDENDVAFCNVVAKDKIMSAGTSSTTDVTATVLNVYGEPLSAKTVAFTVSAGEGAVSPGSDCTNVSGIAETVYTVGDTVGTTTITATASDTTC
jgi:hypothetical protein